jgi:hypothetical protein
VLAQQSPSFQLEEHTFNAGGHPTGGTALSSTSFWLTLGALGQGVAAPGLASASFAMDGGFIATYPPPGEVESLRFADETTLAWDGERSVGDYGLYQGLITEPFDPDYGICQPPGIDGQTTTVAATPGLGETLFVLVTARNRLGEEGSKGFKTDGQERDNPVACP